MPWKLIGGNDMNPLPFKTTAAVFMVVLCAYVSLLMSSSFLPKLVKSFHISEVESGYRCGMLASISQIGWAASAVFWGYMADKYGRKRLLVIGAGCMMSATLAFGFSTTFYWALLTRLFYGFSMGSCAVGKTMLVQISDCTNKSFALSIYCSCWTIAFIAGPSFAGFLVFPADQYPTVFKKDSLFGKYGVLLPCLILTAMWIIAISCVIQVVPNILIEENDDLQRLLHDGSDDEDISSKKDQMVSPVQSSLTWAKMLLLFQSKDFDVSLFLMFLTGAIPFSFLLPIFAATSKSYMGLSMNPSQIGWVLLIAGAIMLPFQILFGQRLTTKLGPRWALICSTVALSIMTPLIPLSFYLHSKMAIYIFIVLVTAACFCLVNTILVQVNLLINQSATPDLSGCAYGIGASINCIGSFCGVLGCGRIYSWSLTNVKNMAQNELALGFPFNQFFAFFVTSFCCLLMAVVALLCLSRSEEGRNKV